MSLEIDVSFFWKGTKQITVQVPNKPKDIYDAEGIVWGSIRLWFEKSSIPVPEFVRNVQIIGVTDFHWDILPTKSSNE